MQQWLGTREWTTRFAVLQGPAGVGRTTVVRLTFPGALWLNCETASLELLTAAFSPRRPQLDFRGGFTQTSTTGLVIQDYGALPIVVRDYLLKLVRHYARADELFPIPLVIMLDAGDWAPRLYAEFAPRSLRITVAKVGTKALFALGLKLTQRADGVTSQRGMTATPRQRSCIDQCAKQAVNVRHFVASLESRLHNAVLRDWGLVDTLVSPFEAIRVLIGGSAADPRVHTTALASFDGDALLHWAYGNLPELVAAVLPDTSGFAHLEAFLQSVAQADALRSAYGWQPVDPVTFTLKQAFVAAALRLHSTRGTGFPANGLRDFVPTYPQSLRKLEPARVPTEDKSDDALRKAALRTEFHRMTYR